MPSRFDESSNLVPFPIQSFFNAVSDSDYLHMVDCLTSGVGFHVNDAHCVFPEDLDPAEPRFEGVRFSLFEDVFIASNGEVRYLLALLSKEYLMSHPEDLQTINNFLSRS